MQTKNISRPINLHSLALFFPRKLASLSTLRPTFSEEKNTLTLSGDGQESLTLPLTQDLSKLEKRDVQLWKDTLTVYDMGDEASKWCTQFMKNHRLQDVANDHNKKDPLGENDSVMPVRLVTLEDPKKGVYSRPSHPKLEGIHTAFQDWSPISFGFTSSLEEVNKGLLETGINKGGEQIPINRFRNNITISGTLPWEEDQWLVAK